MSTYVVERAQSRIAENTREIERRIADNARWQQFLAQVQELVGDLGPQPSPSSSPVVAAQTEEGAPTSSADQIQEPQPETAVQMQAGEVVRLSDEPAFPASLAGAEGIVDRQPIQPETADQSTAARMDVHVGKMAAKDGAQSLSEATAPPETLGHASAEPAGTQAPPVDTVNEATGKSAEPSGSAAPLPMREQIRLCHQEHPDWPVKVIAEHLGCPPKTVSAYASKLGLRMASVASYEAAQAAKTTEALKVAATSFAALPSAESDTLAGRVRRLHAQHPNLTARLIAKELGANLNSVATLLTQIRKTVPAPAAKPEFSGRKEMVEHYGKIAERLGKPK